MKIYVLNGPNLNLLGDREPEVYGTTTLAEIEKMCGKRAADLGIEVVFRQSNHEGVLIDWIHEARQEADALVINPAAFSHYSLAIREALAAFDKPSIELHLSNVFARESWRASSVVSEVVDTVIAGLGPDGYVVAIEALIKP